MPAFADAPYVTWYDIGQGAGDAASNMASFRYSGLLSDGNYQFAAYYEPDDLNYSNGVDDGVAVIARRELIGGTTWGAWQTYRTEFTANNLYDGHDTISFGIDGDGIMHMSWGMHGDPYHYAKTNSSVLNSSVITFGSDLGTMTGIESGVTYPQFYSLPDGDLLYLFRVAGSGAGDTKLNRYDITTDTWSRVQNPLIYRQGSGYQSVNAYPQIMVVDSQGDLQLTWCWRTGADSTVPDPLNPGNNMSGYQTNHNICYAKSTNGGVTWTRTNDTSYYSLPIEE
ncbi:MAG: BNR-4 repeat-containing protein, partial [Thermoguttaceae bacterium]